MSRRTSTLVGLLTLAAVGLAAQPAAAAAHPNRGDACFLSSQWQGWRAASPSIIYVRVNINEVYRLDLSSPSYSVTYPEVHLFSEIRGSDWICSPLDLQLWVVDNSHSRIREPLFVKSITKLTPDEIRALPPRFRP